MLTTNSFVSPMGKHVTVDQPPLVYILPLPEMAYHPLRQMLMPDDIYRYCAKSLAYMALGQPSCMDDFMTDALCYLESGGAEWPDDWQKPDGLDQAWELRLQQQLDRMSLGVYHDALVIWLGDFYYRVWDLAKAHLGPSGWSVGEVVDWNLGRAIAIEVYYDVTAA